MRFSNFFVLAVALVACASATAQTVKYDNVGRAATPEEIQTRDITILPSGKGLAAREGNRQGRRLDLCVPLRDCHGATGKEGGPLAPKLVGDTSYERGPMTSWPFATSVWDYINRAMPRYQEGTLTPDQVYAVTAFLLYRSGIVKENDILDAKSVTELQMPNRNGWVPSRLNDIPNLSVAVGYIPRAVPTSAHDEQTSRLRLIERLEQAAENLRSVRQLERMLCTSNNDMRGPDEKQSEFSHVLLNNGFPAITRWRIRPMVDRGLEEMWSHFEALYARRGRPSIAPERLLRALLLQALYSIRSETQLMEQLDYNLFVPVVCGIESDYPVWDVTVFTEESGERLMAGEVSQRLLEAVLRQAGEHDLLKRGTLHGGRDAHPRLGPAGRVSCRREAAGEGSGSRGKKLLRDTHESKELIPEARLFKTLGGASAAEFFGTPNNGESQRTGDGGLGHAMRHLGRTSGAGDAGSVGPEPGAGGPAHCRRSRWGADKLVSGERIHRRLRGATCMWPNMNLIPEVAELADRAGKVAATRATPSARKRKQRESVWLARNSKYLRQVKVRQRSELVVPLVGARWRNCRACVYPGGVVKAV